MNLTERMHICHLLVNMETKPQYCREIGLEDVSYYTKSNEQNCTKQSTLIKKISA